MATFVAQIDHPALQASVADFVRRAQLKDLKIQGSNEGNAADLIIGSDVRGVRLGLLIDWLVRRRDDSRTQFGSDLELPTGRLQLASLTFSPSDGRPPVRLTDKEQDLLLALYAAPGRTLNKADLLQRVWGYVEGVETHTLETHVYRLRQKIERDPANPVLLLTDTSSYRLAI